MEVAAAGQELVRELLLAECNYHLGRTEEVVRELRRAVRIGCDHPLVHFALGYNLYAGAVQQFTRAGAARGGGREGSRPRSRTSAARRLPPSSTARATTVVRRADLLVDRA